mgnify:FL=1
MRGPKHVTITILWGLPGSGKTHYATEHYSTNVYGNGVVNVDHIRASHKGDEFYRVLIKKTQDALYAKDKAVLDGLFTTNEEVRKVCELTSFGLSTLFKILFKIVYWDKNVESCIHNDRGRRKIDSIATIENLPFERPNPSKLGGSVTEKHITKRKIVKKPEYLAWAQEEKIVNDETGVLRSSTWSLGGKCGDNYTSPDPQPINFDEFDRLLFKICPDISFLKYKKLYKESVEIKVETRHDYYETEYSYAFYECNLSKFYSMLQELELLEVESCQQ